MKKFSKLIAVVLAIAVIICPMMSVVSHATTTNGYKIEANPNDANELMLTISSTDGFVAYDATVTFNGPSAFQSTYDTGDYDNGLRLISREVKGGEANSHNLPTISSNMTNDTTLKVIVIKDDFTGDDLYTKLVIGLRVAAGSTATLTKIQAADQGTVAEDSTLLTFPAANESTGEIDQTDEYAKENATITVHTHDLTLVPKKDATCTEPGNNAYYTCSCGKIFSDSEGTTETTLQAVTIAAKGHTVVEDAAVAATCTETGLTAGSHCSVCNTVLVAQETIPATGHTPAEAVVENNVPATCTTAGHYDSVVKCSVCNTEISRETVDVPATGHTPATAVEENRVEATCGVAGHYDSVVYCSECDAEISRETIVIPATGNHNWGEWTIDADGHSRTCSVCNAVDSGTHDGSPCSVCGYEAAPAEIPVINSLQLGRNILARDSLGVRIMVIPSQVASYDSYYVEVKSKHFRTKDNAPYSLVEDIDLFTYVAEGDEVPSGYHAQAEVNNYHNFEYTGITAFEMTLPMEITLYVCNGGVPVGKSTTYEFSLASRIKTSYIKNNANDAAFVDMLNYGAVVQRYFADANPTSDLAAHGVYPNDDLAQTYATPDSVASVDVSAVSVNANESKPINTAKAAVGKGMQISNKNNIKYLINPSTYEGTTLRVTYEDSYGEDHSVEVDISDCEREGSYYSYFYDKVALYDTHKEVVAGLYNAAGELLYTRTYSVASYFFETKANAANKAVGDALMKFTYSLRKNLNLN